MCEVTIDTSSHAEFIRQMNITKMLCLVSKPNSEILEVRVDPKAIGQECLEKACSKLGIGAEADYFGLRVVRGAAIVGGGVATQAPAAARAGRPAAVRWLNLRNPLCGGGGAAGGARRLALRVKFWVPPHLLLAEPTRHLFYLHARRDLLEGRLVVADRDVAKRLVAYIAQAETGDYDPEAPPHAAYAQCENIGPRGEKPEDHLEKIVDYHCEIGGMRSSQAEYRLLKEISNLESFGEELFFCKPINAQNNAHNLYEHLLYHGPGEEEPPLSRGDDPDVYGSQTVGCLATGGATGGAAGEQGCGCKLSVSVGVGPHGLVVYRPDCCGDRDMEEKQSIPYAAINRAQPQRRNFQLFHLTADGHEAMLNIKMATSGQAAALYRAVTEKHAFYCCETVRSAVTKQFIRDLKGTIVSIFNEDSSLGKRYVFDIRRTCREVYDNARRAAFLAAQQAAQCHPQNRRPSQSGTELKESREKQQSSHYQQPQQDPLACRICMDATMDTLFLPCRHVLCCEGCATRCNRCPLCRGEIDKSMRIYLPVDIGHRVVP